MTAKRNIGDEIIQGLEQALAYTRGEPAEVVVHHVSVPEAVDVRAIRQRAGLTQRAFAERYGFSPAAVRDWEQGRRRPERAARILLTIIDRRPDAVDEALRAG